MDISVPLALIFFIVGISFTYVYWLQSYKFSLRIKPFVAKIIHYLIENSLSKVAPLYCHHSHMMTGQVLSKFIWFVAFGGSCRYKLGKIWRIFLDWTDFHRNFASDLRFTHNLVWVVFISLFLLLGYWLVSNCLGLAGMRALSICSKLVWHVASLMLHGQDEIAIVLASLW